MRKTICIILIVTLMMGALAGCKETPESPIVMGKNAEQMLEAAQRTETEQKDNDEGSIDLYTRLGAPENYTVELTSKKGKLSVYVDAPVLLPEFELPILRVKPVEFTLEQVERFAKVLMGSDARYVQFDENKQTKGVYERIIEHLRAGIADWENTGQYVFDLQYYSKEEAEQALSELLVKAADAPDILPTITPNFTWSKPQVVTGDGEIEHNNTFLTLWAMPDDASYSWLSIHNNREFDGNADLKYIRDFAVPMDSFDYKVADITGMLSFSEENAYALAEQTIASMGLDGFICSARYGMFYRGSFNEQLPAYHFMFTRQINGVIETYTNAEKANDSYNTSWYYEKVHVLIDEKGVLRVEYYSPYALLETVMEETELLPFEQIQSIFEKMVVIANNEVDDNPVWGASGKMEYHITTVRLGFISMREQNKDTGLLIPAWDFMGYDQGRMSADQQWGKTNTNELKSYLTINAIDGSIIERGY